MVRFEAMMQAYQPLEDMFGRGGSGGAERQLYPQAPLLHFTTDQDAPVYLKADTETLNMFSIGLDTYMRLATISHNLLSQEPPKYLELVTTLANLSPNFDVPFEGPAVQPDRKSTIELMSTTWKNTLLLITRFPNIVDIGEITQEKVNDIESQARTLLSDDTNLRIKRTEYGSPFQKFKDIREELAKEMRRRHDVLLATEVSPVIHQVNSHISSTNIHDVLTNIHFLSHELRNISVGVTGNLEVNYIGRLPSQWRKLFRFFDYSREIIERNYIQTNAGVDYFLPILRDELLPSDIMLEIPDEIKTKKIVFSQTLLWLLINNVMQNRNRHADQTSLTVTARNKIDDGKPVIQILFMDQGTNPILSEVLPNAGGFREHVGADVEESQHIGMGNLRKIVENQFHGELFIQARNTIEGQENMPGACVILQLPVAA